MDDAYANSAEAYEALLELEQVFLDHLKDEEIRDSYLSARKGKKAGWRTLTTIASPAWAGTPATER